MYAVIEREHITGATFNETVIFVGSKEECTQVEHNTRLTYRNTVEIDCYTVDINEYERTAKYLEALKAHAETLTAEQKKEVIEINGKRYIKYIVDFKNEYFK